MYLKANDNICLILNERGPAHLFRDSQKEKTASPVLSYEETRIWKKKKKTQTSKSLFLCVIREKSKAKHKYAKCTHKRTLN